MMKAILLKLPEDLKLRFQVTTLEHKTKMRYVLQAFVESFVNSPERHERELTRAVEIDLESK